MTFKIGDFVNWMEEYADGIPGRDWGDGIIIEKRNSRNLTQGSNIMYKVYRNKHRDVCWFEERRIFLKETE